MVLPDADKGDLFFDFEGDPLWTVDGRELGTRVPVGRTDTTDNSTRSGRTTVPANGRRCVDFLAMVRKRRKRYPGMHIYHYAAYEKSTLLRLAGRYGVGEDEVDDLLRKASSSTCIPMVRKSIRVGTENYSIKSLEPLYMGNELRTGEVTTAADSITQYARYCALRDEGRVDEAAAVLKEIEDYNVYDCRSTRRLRDWMMARAIESGVPPRGPAAGPRKASRSARRTTTSNALLKFAGDGVTRIGHPSRPPWQWWPAARGYHKREDKPFWWGHFDRVNNPVDEWADNSGRLHRRPRRDRHRLAPAAESRKPQRHVRLTGEIANGGTVDGHVRALRPARARWLDDDPDRRAFGVAVLDVKRRPEAPTEVIIWSRQPKDGDVVRPGAVRPHAGAADQHHQTSAGLHRGDRRDSSRSDCR